MTLRIATLYIAALAALVAIWTPSARAEPAASRGEHRTGGGAHGDTGTDGMPGRISEADRTIRIAARDIAFNVTRVQVRAGETVRFVITNTGKLRHEFVIASHAEHLEHRAMMRQMPNMEMGSEPNAVTVDPGQTKSIVWKFGKARDVEFACDIPGHAEAGMTGIFKVMQ